MSLVGTYVRCNDGNLYENPVWYGTHEGKKWTICFDDDDPPEIVVQQGLDHSGILSIIDIPFRIIGRGSRGSRLFPHDKYKKFVKADSMFFEWSTRPAPPQIGKITNRDSIFQGVFYEYKETNEKD